MGSGGHSHGAADLRDGTSSGYVLLDSGAWGQVPAAGVASDAITTAKVLDLNITTGKLAAAAVTSAKLDPTTVQYAEVAITSAAIVATAAGGLSHADGVPLVASPGAGKVLEFLSAVLIYDYAGAGYGGGDPLTINYAGGSAISSAVAAANSLGAGADKIVQFVPLAVNANAMAAATGLNLVTASGTDWTLGSATGVVRVKVAYRVHTTGLA